MSNVEEFATAARKICLVLALKIAEAAKQSRCYERDAMIQQLVAEIERIASDPENYGGVRIGLCIPELKSIIEDLVYARCPQLKFELTRLAADLTRGWKI